MLDDDDRSDDELSKTPPPRCVVAGLVSFDEGERSYARQSVGLSVKRHEKLPSSELRFGLSGRGSFARSWFTSQPPHRTCYKHLDQRKVSVGCQAEGEHFRDLRHRPLVALQDRQAHRQPTGDRKARD